MLDSLFLQPNLLGIIFRMKFCYYSAVISIIAGVNLFDVDDYYIDEIIITTVFPRVPDDLNISLNSNSMYLSDSLVSLLLCYRCS